MPRLKSDCAPRCEVDGQGKGEGLSPKHETTGPDCCGDNTYEERMVISCDVRGGLESSTLTTQLPFPVVDRVSLFHKVMESDTKHRKDTFADELPKP